MMATRGNDGVGKVPSTAPECNCADQPGSCVAEKWRAAHPGRETEVACKCICAFGEGKREECIAVKHKRASECDWMERESLFWGIL